jgi:hypothetical protein
MKKKNKQGNLLRAIAFTLIWLVPLIYIAFITIDITTTTPTDTPSGQRIVFSVWSLLVLGILVFVYIVQVRKRLIKVLDVSDIQGRPVPAFWRFIQLVEYAVSFALLIGAVYVVNALSNVLYTFAIVSLISGTIGHIFLMIDSIQREKLYQENKLLNRGQ